MDVNRTSLFDRFIIARVRHAAMDAEQQHIGGACLPYAYGALAIAQRQFECLIFLVAKRAH